MDDVDAGRAIFLSRNTMEAPWFEIELDVPVVMTGVGKGN